MGVAMSANARIAREAWALVRQGALIAGPTRWHRARVERSGPLTVFVHGFFAPMARWLGEQGVADRQLHFSYPPLGSIDGLARALSDRIAALQPTGPVNFVGHSLGGLLGRYYVQILGGRVDRLVCLATPHRGTLHARPWTRVPLAREIAPTSATVLELHSTRDRLRGVRVCSVVGDEDRMVVPFESAVLEDHENVRFERVGHQSLLFSRPAWEHVARVLSEPTATDD